MTDSALSLPHTIYQDTDHHEELEVLRQHALEELGLIDTPESESFDRITRMASRLFGAPVAAVSLTDRSRQWFKSHIGTSGRELPRTGAPCAEVARTGAFLNIPDLREDPRFTDSPITLSGMRFYAGAPLTTRSGYTLGAMCVLDSEPRIFTAEQMTSLEDLASMVMAQIELQHNFGRMDATSGLPNRHQLYDDIEDQRRRTPGALQYLLLIELADLRHVNDAVSVVGASYLDALIKSSTAAIREAVGAKAILYQVGFASIAVLLQDQEQGAINRAKSLAHLLKVPATANDIPIIVNAALGLTTFQLGVVSPQDALRTGISAARQARASELDYAIYSADSDAAHKRRFHLITHLSESLDRQADFKLVYQPRLDLHTNRCSSAEALLRWTHPELGSVSPGEFIPLVEQTALARPMTQWVLASAFRQIRDWRDRGIDLKLSINVSARNLEEEDFVDLLRVALAEYNLQPTDIELEFTESALIRFQSRVLRQLTAIRDMGVLLAIDDFGTGYSSFSYLRQLPAAVVKLDQSFMRGLAQSPKDQSMVRSMIRMAQDIGYRVVAEGIETADILELLRSFGCDEIQGFFIARPLAPADLEKFLTDWEARSLRAA